MNELATIETAPTFTTRVPNTLPTFASSVPYRIAIVGEAPDKTDVDALRPFVGASGRLLNQILDRWQILRDACFVGNVCQLRPPNSRIENFAWDGEEIQSGIRQLSSDLALFQPNICILLGNAALRAFKGHDGISNWRGSFFISDQPLLSGYKCLASYHPAACLREYSLVEILKLDFRKAKAEAESRDLLLPSRQIDAILPYDTLVSNLHRILNLKPKISIDIEGYVYNMSCCSIADSSTSAFVVPFSHSYDESQESYIWTLFSQILADPQIPKVLQNGLYDRFVLTFGHSCHVANVVDDTMLKFWEKYCELEKSLAFQASVLTKEPYYKHERKTDSLETHLRYCGKDGCVTYEINERLSSLLDAPSRAHYEFNVALLNALLYMELRGIKYDTRLAAQRLEVVESYLYKQQAELDLLAGVGTPSVEEAKAVMCYKKDQDRPKKEYEKVYDKIMLILGLVLQSNQTGSAMPSASDIAWVNTQLGRSLNLKSPTFKAFLYSTLGLPKQYKIDPITKLKTLTTNYEALLKIQKSSPHRAVELSLDIGELRTRSQMLHIAADNDGRVRCGYNIVGTETGRLTCYTSPTGSGYNLQTIPSKQTLKPKDHPLREGMRDLFLADDGYYLFQCDLSGADGWTVAAHLASLGDRTMLDDYKIGIKPAKVLCFMLRHGAGSLRGKTREEIKALTKPISGEDWDYFACKIGQHGTSYLMGAQKLANQIFIQSEGKVSLSAKECDDLQRLFKHRYNVEIWHRATQRALNKKPLMTSASGHTRRFFGRYNEILGQALAHEPQANTTYATNLAVWRLWTDRENRSEQDRSDLSPQSGGVRTMEGMPSSDGRGRRVALRIEPLHQVHDALVGQFRIEDTSWAVGKIKSYFDNPIKIAGQLITIPFEGAYGESWGKLEKGVI